MAYCRFSTDDFQCDVYVYEDVDGGYTIHVAKICLVYNDPIPPKVPMSDIDAFIERRTIMDEIYKCADEAPTPLQYAGKSFNYDTATDAAAFLQELKHLGYRVPDSVIKDLIDESC